MCTVPTRVGCKGSYIDRITALLRDIGDRTEASGTEHDLVVVNERVLVDAAKDVTSGYVVANLKRYIDTDEVGEHAEPHTL